MRLGVLFSGGKDSTYAMMKAKFHHEISCLITMKSSNSDSYMFHTPNIDIVELQAESMEIPLLSALTKGVKEKELTDLRALMVQAKEIFRIEGIVTGAIESVYQASRIQTICDDLGLWCFNPLWKMDQEQLLHELLENGFEIIFTAVAGYPLDRTWLGRSLDKAAISELVSMRQKYSLNPSGEGGETESLVLNCPLFRKRLEVKGKKSFSGHAGLFRITEANLV